MVSENTIIHHATPRETNPEHFECISSTSQNTTDDYQIAMF